MAREFSEDILRAVPKYIPSLKIQPETAKHNVRYGRNDAVYVNEWGIESKGMCASVMMVKDRTTGNIFGAKEPYYKTSDNPDTARKRFEALQREYRHIMQLNHPYIVKAYDLILDEDLTLPPWMIVEYIPLNLSEIITDLNERERLTVLTHLSSALHHMHACGITHRDVKPDNVLIKRRGQELNIKLADFGTSKHNAAGKMDTFTGTKSYMAPELFEETRRYTNKVDIWSLGLIGIQLFTTWDPTSDEKWDSIDFGPPMRNVILPHVVEAPEQFRPLLKRLLRKNPERRWSAWKCLKYLSNHTQTGDVLIRIDEPTITDNEAAVNSKKRPASTQDEDLFKADDHERRTRSPNPSLSASRVRAVLPAEHISEEGSTLPNTLSPRTWVPEPVSAASKPHPDTEFADDGDGDAEEKSSDSGDTELEDDWKEDDGQAKENE